MAVMRSSPWRFILAIMLATTFLSMWVSDITVTAMTMPVALSALARVLSHEEVYEADATEGSFSNMQIATLLGTAYTANVDGVGTLIGTPPSAVVATQLDALLGYDIDFTEWLLVDLPIAAVTLPIVWYLLTFRSYPSEVSDVEDAREQAREYLADEGALSTRDRRVVYIFAVTAGLQVLGGLDLAFEGVLSDQVLNTLFGTAEGTALLGAEGHQDLLYYVMIGMVSIPALVLADTMEWDELVGIDWRTILFFGGDISLADAFAFAGATRWLAEAVFDPLTGAPIVLVVGVIMLLATFLTEMTSNTATAIVIVLVLIDIESVFAAALGLTGVSATVFLAISGAIAASFVFTLPVATPPNAIAFGNGHIKQSHMAQTGAVLNVTIVGVLTIPIWFLFQFVWLTFLW